MDLSETYLKYANDAFSRLPTLSGQFDLIYIDAAEEEYEEYVRYILDHKLLSPRGVILVDDVLLEGLVLDRSIANTFPEEIREPYLAVADCMTRFNRYAADEPRVNTTLIPVFNGGHADYVGSEDFGDDFFEEEKRKSQSSSR
ncbi:predicted protein [Uncinocarpus reesii 1704]|uniref:Caffeoyl-CoA O-methyltransferase n=1 Tax=Uncinocarpus reesii (strain UAMH 1704) TaxID=336963 RepID=C4JN08_UNCRE|nr:uncharacterized protein UREG_04216 [Uncinocarpus reesii 1704]EEP79370.1 predicted protein [Uncinocarpus reesii 1704]